MKVIARSADYVAIEFRNSEIVEALRHAQLIPAGLEPKTWRMSTGYMTVEFERTQSAPETRVNEVSAASAVGAAGALSERSGGAPASSQPTLAEAFERLRKVYVPRDVPDETLDRSKPRISPLERGTPRHGGNCPCWDCTRDQFGL